jgi:hypothetical protein
MYADDMVFFVKPTREDLLNFFEEALGLKTNLQKSAFILIHYEGWNLNNILASSPTKVSRSPIKYLGLLLTAKRLKRVDFQALVDKSDQQAHPLEWASNEPSRLLDLG